MEDKVCVFCFWCSQGKVEFDGFVFCFSVAIHYPGVLPEGCVVFSAFRISHFSETVIFKGSLNIFADREFVK